MDREKMMKLLSSDSWEDIQLGWEFLMKYHYPRTEHAWHQILNLCYQKNAIDKHPRMDLFHKLIVPAIFPPGGNVMQSSIYRSWKETWPYLIKRLKNENR